VTFCLNAVLITHTESTKRKLKRWNSAEVPPLYGPAIQWRRIKSKNTYSVEFIIEGNSYTLLLGYKTAKNMKLMKINQHNREEIAEFSPVEQPLETFDGKLVAFPRKEKLILPES